MAAQHSTAAVHTPRQPHNRASTGDSTCTKRHKHVKQTQTRWANQRRKHPTKTRAERSSGAHQGSHTQPSKHGRGHTAWAHSVDTQRGHTAWTHSKHTQAHSNKRASLLTPTRHPPPPPTAAVWSGDGGPWCWMGLPWPTSPPLLPSLTSSPSSS